jgi:hypothetical protein
MGLLYEQQTVNIEAGLAASPWQQTDDTATRVNGHNQHCHVLSNPLYTAYTTKPKKDRLTMPHDVAVDKATFTMCLQEHVPKTGPQQAQLER